MIVIACCRGISSMKGIFTNFSHLFRFPFHLLCDKFLAYFFCTFVLFSCFTVPSMTAIRGCMEGLMPVNERICFWLSFLEFLMNERVDAGALPCLKYVPNSKKNNTLACDRWGVSLVSDLNSNIAPYWLHAKIFYFTFQIGSNLGFRLQFARAWSVFRTCKCPNSHSRSILGNRP